MWIAPLATRMTPDTPDIINNFNMLLCSDAATGLPSTRHTLELLCRGANRFTFMMIHLQFWPQSPCFHWHNLPGLRVLSVVGKVNKACLKSNHQICDLDLIFNLFFSLSPPFTSGFIIFLNTSTEHNIGESHFQA